MTWWDNKINAIRKTKVGNIHWYITCNMQFQINNSTLKIQLKRIYMIKKMKVLAVGQQFQMFKTKSVLPLLLLFFTKVTPSFLYFIWFHNICPSEVPGFVITINLRYTSAYKMLVNSNLLTLNLKSSRIWKIYCYKRSTMHFQIYILTFH